MTKVGKYNSTMGYRNPNAKFTAEDVKIIRYFVSTFKERHIKLKLAAYKILAEKYKCSPGTIYRITTNNPKWRRYQNVQ